MIEAIKISNIDRAKNAMVAALGSDAVLTTDEQVKEFRDPYEGAGATDFQPSFVVQPTTVEEVQEIVRIARDVGVPIWTSSTGRNYGYGGSAPVVSGSIVLNFRRMNKVLEINEEAGYALVEPGVRFFDLYDAIKAQGAKLMMSCPDIGWGSLVGNALDHGYGYTEMGDHSEAVCGMEVVLASGEVLRTGLGAVTKSPMWQRRKRGFGPQLDNLFMQSNYGIVTKMGRWLSPQPEVIATGSLICDTDDGIVAMIDALRPLMLDGTIQGRPLITSSPEPKDGRAKPGEDTIGASKQKKISAAYPPGRWNARISFYGHESMVNAREVIVRKAFERLPNVTMEIRKYPGNVDRKDVNPLDLVAAGIPNMFLLDELYKHFGLSVGHVCYSPSIPFTGKDAQRHERVIQEIQRDLGLVGGFGWIADARCLQGVSMIMYDVDNKEEILSSHEAVRRMLEKGAELGWTEYRAHPSLIEAVASHFDFGDHSLFKVYGKIKDALDPAGILSPGNHGIWPSDQHWQ
ncbi:FAD-binding oxidoreductase [Nostoc sp.]|uniref:FAD-binding oxidoreductase n=1 Tax=Nostoc sp. TaxID=1180 RepID=UPI002FF90EB8